MFGSLGGRPKPDISMSRSLARGLETISPLFLSLLATLRAASACSGVSNLPFFRSAINSALAKWNGKASAIALTVSRYSLGVASVGTWASAFFLASLNTLSRSASLASTCGACDAGATFSGLLVSSASSAAFSRLLAAASSPYLDFASSFAIQLLPTSSRSLATSSAPPSLVCSSIERRSEPFRSIGAMAFFSSATAGSECWFSGSVSLVMNGLPFEGKPFISSNRSLTWSFSMAAARSISFWRSSSEMLRSAIILRIISRCLNDGLFSGASPAFATGFSYVAGVSTSESGAGIAATSIGSCL